MRAVAVAVFLASLEGGAAASDVAVEFGHIRACQYLSATDPADGAINDVWGPPTWVVPGELSVASWVLARGGFRAEAEKAADWLVRVQNTDGSWCNQYSGTVAVDSARHARHTAQAAFFLHTVGNREPAVAKARWWLATLMDPAVKLGADDGLVCGGYDAAGAVLTDRWTSDNAFAVLAFEAAGDTIRRDRVVAGINALLVSGNHWVRKVDKDGVATDGPFGWIGFAPAFLDLGFLGVAYPAGLGAGIAARLQEPAGPNAGAVREFEDGAAYMPGIGFQASLAWRAAGHDAPAAIHTAWAETASGLWQKSPDANGDSGGWIDWTGTAGGGTANWWERFVDTSAYHIMVANGWRFFDPPATPPDLAAPPAPPATLSVYPNPAAGDEATVAVPMRQGETVVVIDAYNTAMQRVFHGRYEAADGGRARLSGLRRWAPGVYVLRIRVGAPGGTMRGAGTARLAVRR